MSRFAKCIFQVRLVSFKNHFSFLSIAYFLVESIDITSPITLGENKKLTSFIRRPNEAPLRKLTKKQDRKFPSHILLN